MTIIDTHAHIDHIQEADAALEEAHQSGVEAILAVGVDLAANQKDLEMVSKISAPKIYLGLGLHPGNITTEAIEETMCFIETNIEKAVAVGEIGLDFWYRWVRKNEEKKKEQKEVFRRQLAIAKERDLPVTIHSRGAWKYCLEIVQEMDVRKGVFHWYSGPVDLLKQILDQGFYVSCTPSLAYSPEARAAMEHVPLDRALIETDSPVFFRIPVDGEEGFYATPRDVWKTLDIYVDLKKLDRDNALSQLNQNARDVFGM